MVDSISIYTEKKIKIKRNTQIQIQQQKSLNENTYFNYHLFEYFTGEPVLGNRAYGNIRDNYNRVLIKIDKKNGYCFFQFSLPFISSGENNLNSLTEKEAGTTFQKVQNLLYQNGFIIPDIFTEDSFTINRVDMFKNIPLKHPYNFYFPVFNHCNGLRMSRKKFGDTFLWTNNNREICVYDKLAEMKANKADMKGIDAKNLLRIEYRLKSNKVIKNLIGTNTIPGLLQNWNRIPILFKSEIKKKLFRGNTKMDLPIQTYFSPRRIYELYQKESGNYSYNKFIKDLGFMALVDLFSYDIDKIKEMIMMGSYKRTVNRRLQELLKAMKNPVNRIIQKSGITLGELYDEIYRAIVSG